MSGEGVDNTPEPVTINELEKLALGRLRLTPEVWGLMTPREFYNCVDGFMSEKSEAENRELGRLRWFAAVLINKDRKKRNHVKPEDLIPLDGDAFKSTGYTEEERREITERYNRAANGK